MWKEEGLAVCFLVGKGLQCPLLTTSRYLFWRKLLSVLKLRVTNVSIFITFFFLFLSFTFFPSQGYTQAHRGTPTTLFIVTIASGRY